MNLVAKTIYFLVILIIDNQTERQTLLGNDEKICYPP